MRRVAWLPVIFLLAALPALAQQEMAPSPEQAPTPTQPAPPTPDADGVYRVVPGISTPALTNAVPAAYPPNALETDRPHIIVLSAVVGIDGVPTNVQPVHPSPGPFEDSAIAAVIQSRFQPGTLEGKPVPVLVYVRVPFFHLAAAVPRLQLHYGMNGNFEPPRLREPLAMQPGYAPPKATYFAPVEYSDEARRKKIQGVVVVSVLVTEEGEPTDAHIEKSLGYGLDEKAIQAALKYKFKPAMRDGNPVSTRITMEMSFRLY